MPGWVFSSPSTPIRPGSWCFLDIFFYVIHQGWVPLPSCSSCAPEHCPGVRSWGPEIRQSMVFGKRKRKENEITFVNGISNVIAATASEAWLTLYSKTAKAKMTDTRGDRYLYIHSSSSSSGAQTHTRRPSPWAKGVGGDVFPFFGSHASSIFGKPMQPRQVGIGKDE